MKRSFSYTIVALVFKLKGLKKIFSSSPIDYKRLRKEDVKKPKGSFYKKKSLIFTVAETTITKIKSRNKSDKVLLFFPGGAFVSGPTKLHWDALKKIHKETDYNIWLCDYPKAPEHKITQISKNIDAVYKLALQNYLSEKIIVMGDSVGGTLAIALLQRLINQQKELPLKNILISPVLDASMTNSAIGKLDIMLAKVGVLSAKQMCAENNDLKAPIISPIYGSFTNFPETIVCIATQDIMCPDEELMIKKLKANNINYKVIYGEGMPHIWPLLPFLKEGKEALNKIILELNA